MSEESESQVKAVEEQAQPEEAASERETVSKENKTASNTSAEQQPDEPEMESETLAKQTTTAATESETENQEAMPGATSCHTAGDTLPDQVKAESAQQDFADYEQHVTYAADGGAIYTDPSTKQKYKWCNTENNWQPLTADEASMAGSLYENEHYKWCPQTQKWLPKQSSASSTETEHYKWDAEQQKWLPKQPQQQPQAAPGQDVVYGIDENGDRIYTDKDGVVFLWDASKSAWFPKIDDDFMARYQMNYGFIDNTSAGEREKEEREAAEVKRKAEELKRMTAEAQAAMNAPILDKDGAPTASVTGKRKAQEPPSNCTSFGFNSSLTYLPLNFSEWFEVDPTQNTKVYVSNLPLDITMDEFAELMGKCGLVMRDPQTQKYKLKLYTEADGQIKGDGLCDYIKVSSNWIQVNIKLQI